MATTAAVMLPPRPAIWRREGRSIEDQALPRWRTVQSAPKPVSMTPTISRSRSIPARRRRPKEREHQ
jgi:hypothetical protein